MQVRYYINPSGRDVFNEWLYNGLKDRQARHAIEQRVKRMQVGNFGDHKFCRDGVWELRIDVGAGYRVYYAKAGQMIILLLCGGAKRTQDTDINQAVKYWIDYQKRLP